MFTIIANNETKRKAFVVLLRTRFKMYTACEVHRRKFHQLKRLKILFFLGCGLSVLDAFCATFCFFFAGFTSA